MRAHGSCRCLAVVPVLAGTLVMLGCTQGVTTQPSERGVRPRPLVVMLTDFGVRDHYVGTLKGVIYTRCPGARIDAITHQITAFDIRQGAEVLRRAAPYFPAGTVFLAIVDPGVGGKRRAIAARTRTGHVFVGPDNGLLWPTLTDQGIETVWHITRAKLLRAGTQSTTFHGRDVFAPIAAYAASGGDLNQVGPTVPPRSLVTVKPDRAEQVGTEVRGRVVRVDRYGNVLTNIPAKLVAALGIRTGHTLRVCVGRTEWAAPLVRTYSDVPTGQRLALINSEGHLELAINQDHLAAHTAIQPGQPVRLSPAD